MLFVIVGVLIIGMNLADIGPFGAWTWEISGDLWKFCVPFGLAALWWTWADKTGLNKRREIEKMEARKQKRRKENLVNLGIDYDQDKRRQNRFQSERQREIERVKGPRAKKRQKDRDSILSGFDSHSADHGTRAGDDGKP